MAERTTNDIMQGLHVYYHPQKDGRYKIFLVQDNYSHTVSILKRTLEFAKDSLKLTIPDEEDISIEVLGGPRHKGVVCIEFFSDTKPLDLGYHNTPCELTNDSGLWQWLLKN